MPVIDLKPLLFFTEKAKGIDVKAFCIRCNDALSDATKPHLCKYCWLEMQA